MERQVYLFCDLDLNSGRDFLRRGLDSMQGIGKEKHGRIWGGKGGQLLSNERRQRYGLRMVRGGVVVVGFDQGVEIPKTHKQEMGIL